MYEQEWSAVLDGCDALETVLDLRLCPTSSDCATDPSTLSPKTTNLPTTGMIGPVNDLVETNMKSPARNWSTGRKAYNTAIVISLDFVACAIGAAGTPLATHAKKQLPVEHSHALFVFTSIYMIGQALGAAFFPPLSEAFGRKPIYVSSSAMFALFTLLAAVPDVRAISVGRFVSGMLSAVSGVVVAGSIEDVWQAQQRVWVFYLWGLISYLGVFLGPVIAVCIAQGPGWQWGFYTSTACMAVMSVLTLSLSESRTCHHLTDTVPGTPTRQKLAHDGLKEVQSFIVPTLARPAHFFVTEPIVFMATCLDSTVCGLAYLLTEALPTIHAGMGLTDQQASFSLLVLASGMLLGIPLYVYEQHVAVKKVKQRQFVPEDRLFGFNIACPALAVALWWFAWTIPPAFQQTSVASIVPLAMIGFCTNAFFVALSGYLTDSYTLYAASANAPVAVFRGILSAASPIIGYKIFGGHLNANTAASILASIATVFCATPLLLAKFGKRLRVASNFAKYSQGVGMQVGEGEVGDSSVAIRMNSER